MKRFLVLLLGLSLFVSMLASNAFAADGIGSLSNFSKVNSYTDGQFSDVSIDTWYSKNVATAFEYGLMSGNSETVFNPNGTITIAETIVLACRIHNIYFDDGYEFAQGTPWYQSYVDYAINNGIISGGYSDYSIAATCAELVEILYGALPNEEFNVINIIQDGGIMGISTLDSCAVPVYAFYKAGIMEGNRDQATFSPELMMSRGGAATIITRMVDKSLRKNLALKAIVISIPDTPLVKSYSGLNNEPLLTCNIAEISYTLNNYYYDSNSFSGADVTLYISGAKTYYKTFCAEQPTNFSVRIYWTLYDSDGYAVKYGHFDTPDIALGESFKDATSAISKLEPGNYILELGGISF